MKRCVNTYIFQRIMLHVATTNRATNLYERQGYAITDTSSACGCAWCASGVRVSYCALIVKVFYSTRCTYIHCTKYATFCIEKDITQDGCDLVIMLSYDRLLDVLKGMDM